jgi:hypothetical protein
MRPIAPVWILLLASAAFAQTSATPAPEPNGIVTGRVFCGDTGRPARFASVSLKPVPPAAAKEKLNLATPAAVAPRSTTTTLSVDTALDGSYTLTHVAPGSYYVIVKKDGYISPLTMFSKKQIDEPTDQIRALIEQALPRVQIEQDSSAHADVQLQRGAAVSGTISYDDETPATGVSMTILHKDENGKWVPVSSGAHMGGIFTNDRGSFRIASLLPDTYMLKANLYLGDERTSLINDGAGHTNEMTLRNSRSTLAFYGEGTPHMDQAITFTLRGSDERTGQDMAIPISKLHRLTGRVAAGANGHFVNAASIELIDTSAKDKTALANTRIDREDGLFHFDFVPEGDYTLKVTNARDVTWEPADAPAPGPMMPPPGFPRPDKERTTKAYGDAEMPLLIRGDMLDVIATVKPQSTKTAETPGAR